MKPENRLWVEILMRTPTLVAMPTPELRVHLAMGGFPDDVITAFMQERKKCPSPSPEKPPR